MFENYLMVSSNIWLMLAGIAIFMYAMSLFEESIRQLSGKRFKSYLQKRTNTKLKAIFSGAIITAVLQSSSIVLLMTLSFVGAGVISTTNALGVVMGANLGTTISGWIVATLGFKLSIDKLAYPFLAFTFILRLLLPNRNIKTQIINLFVGFGLLFIGLEWMKNSTEHLIETVNISLYTHYSPHLFILIGVVLTALIQSSSAMMAIVLTALYHGILPFEHAVGIVIGSELGTTLKIVLGGFSGSVDKKRVSIGNLLYNLMGVLISSLFLYPFIYLIKVQIGVSDNLIALVLFQTMINFLAIVLIYPFVDKCSAFLHQLIKNNDEICGLVFLEKGKRIELKERNLLKSELLQFLKKVVSFNRLFLCKNNSLDRNTSWVNNLRSVANSTASSEESYKLIKQSHGAIAEIILMSKEVDDYEQIRIAINIINEGLHAAKNVKDIAHNLVDMEMEDNVFVLELLVSFRKEASQFYKIIEEYLSKGLDGAKYAIEIELLLHNLTTKHNEILTRTLDLLNTKQIKEVDMATLQNVNREVFAAHKAILMAVSMIYEKM